MPNRKRRKSRRPAAREWVGGLIRTPFYIEDRDPPYRAEAVFWLELPDGGIVATDMVTPGETDGVVGKTLQAAMARPMIGAPRRPDRIRVASATVADEVRAVVGDAIPIEIAPTPELEQIIDAMVETMEEEEPEDLIPETYLRDGNIQADTVAAMFQAAAVLYRLAPWTEVTEEQVLRLDIPALDVEGACLVVIGSLGESLGLLIFPSLAGFEAFHAAADLGEASFESRDLGSGWLALNFQRGADLPDAMRQEVAVHGWPVADAEAYPVVDSFDQDIVVAPHSERDMKIAAAAASAFSQFFAENRKMFADDEPESVCGSFFDQDDLEVRLTAPYDAYPDFDLPASSEANTGDRLANELLEFAATRFRTKWIRFARAFTDFEETMQLAIPWSVYEFEVEGATVLAWYLEEHGGRLSPDARAIAEIQQNAWLSVWEVTAVEPGASLTVTDLLSGETRQVRDTTASRALVVRDAILARLADHDDVTLLAGVHPRPLPPTDAAEVVRLARGRLRRKRAVPVDRLRDGKFGSYLIRRWEKHVAIMDARQPVVPRLSNTDGDPILLTVDHFRLEAGARAEVASKLSQMDLVTPPDPAMDTHEYIFTRPGGVMQKNPTHTLLGRCWFEGNKLHLETNSVQRADDLRSRVETACAGLIRHQLREHMDPRSPEFAGLVEGGAEPEPEESTESTAELRNIEREFKRRHYATWPDHPLPALGGRTPRQAARTAAGRRELDVLLKSMENMENRGSGAEAFDFSPLRRELGLE